MDLGEKGDGRSGRSEGRRKYGQGELYEKRVDFQFKKQNEASLVIVVLGPESEALAPHPLIPSITGVLVPARQYPLPSYPIYNRGAGPCQAMSLTLLAHL